MQEIIAYGLLLVALYFLVRKFIWKPKSKSGSNCDSDCNCH